MNKLIRRLRLLYVRRLVANADELAGLPLFEPLSDSDRQEVARWFEQRTADEGVRLIGEGAAGYSFFVLTEGSAVATSGDTKLAELGPGDFFGEVAILGESRRTATVTTTAPAKLLVMFGSDFRMLQQAQPGIAARVEEVMQDRLT